MLNRGPFAPRDLPTPRAGEAPPEIIGHGSPTQRVYFTTADGQRISQRAISRMHAARRTSEDDAREQQAIADAVEGVIP